MTFKKAVEDFANTTKRCDDYWSMQVAWSCYIDQLCKDGIITQRQWQNWGNPCKPETFKRWNNKWYGLVKH